MRHLTLAVVLSAITAASAGAALAAPPLMGRSAPPARPMSTPRSGPSWRAPSAHRPGFAPTGATTSAFAAARTRAETPGFSRFYSARADSRWTVARHLGQPQSGWRDGHDHDRDRGGRFWIGYPAYGLWGYPYGYPEGFYGYPYGGYAADYPDVDGYDAWDYDDAPNAYLGNPDAYGDDADSYPSAPDDLGAEASPYGPPPPSYDAPEPPADGYGPPPYAPLGYVW